MKHQTQLNLDADITFEILEPIQVEDYILPPMIELNSVHLSLEKPDGKKARVNILKVLDESQRMLIEDEIIEALVDKA
jgi:hypothetical protein